MLSLEGPALDIGVEFYTNAGPDMKDESAVCFRCPGQEDAVASIGGAGKKHLHHIPLRADDLSEIATRGFKAGGAVIEPLAGFVSRDFVHNC